MESNEKIVVHEDNIGNRLYVKNSYDLSNQRISGSIRLKYKGDKVAKFIGEIDYQTNTLQLNRLTDKHYDYKRKGYHIPAYFLNNTLLPVEIIILHIDQQKSFRLEKSVIESFNGNTEQFTKNVTIPFKIIRNYRLKYAPTNMLIN
jgi:hypothetical protein